MRILHLAAGNRWTGAAAPAFAEVEALRAAGVDAHYVYVGGYKLEQKIRSVPFAHPLIEKAQNPAAFLRTVRDLTALGPFDIVHAHLTWDHWIARFLAHRTGARMARTFHSRRTLRSDPLTKLLVARTTIFCVVNETLLGEPPISGLGAIFTPPPVDHRQFTPVGGDVRALHGIDPAAPLVAAIGKLSAGRGFETALRAFALIRDGVPGTRMMIIGHGEHRPSLEALAAELGIAEEVVWAGYHEDDLASHYRAANVLLFAERGSDEGHRAVVEAMACGIAPVTAPIAGMEGLLRPFHGQLIAPERSPDSIAQTAIAILRADHRTLGLDLAAHSQQFGFAPSAERLLRVYGSAMVRS